MEALARNQTEPESSQKGRGSSWVELVDFLSNDILEERLDRNPRAVKEPLAADLAGDAFHRRTLAPIEHDLSLRARRTKASTHQQFSI